MDTKVLEGPRDARTAAERMRSPSSSPDTVPSRCVQHRTLGIPVLYAIVTIRSVRGKVQTSSYIMRLIDGPKKKSQGYLAGIDHSSAVFFCVFGPTGSLLQLSA
jgi:hypothetical protein